MLAEEDWQIFDWLQGRVRPESAAMRALLVKILAHRGKL